MTSRDQEEQDWKIEQMIEDIVQKRVAAVIAFDKRPRKAANELRQFRLEIVKALAAFIAASAVMTGAIIGLSNWLHPVGQQSMFPPGTVITIPPAAKS